MIKLPSERSTLPLSCREAVVLFRLETGFEIIEAIAVLTACAFILRRCITL
jgi:hypothetical protein